MKEHSSSSPTVLWGALLLSLTLLAPTSVAGEGSPPSLVLLTLDTVRADHLGAYGAEDATTPHLDTLARRGVRYATALTPAPLTLPSHASLLTGLEPPEHGLRDNGIAALPEGIPTLATELSRRGYATAAVVGSRVLDRRFGLSRGFDSYDDAMSADALGEYGYPERRSDQVVDAALHWLGQRAKDRPFFLWVHFYDAHAPYDPPPPWSGYRGEVSFVDAQVGRLLESLDSVLDTTVIAAVGDHGESLGEHGEEGHGIFLYRAVLEVPLLIAGPGITPGVVESPVPVLRLGATLLDALGLEEHRLPSARLPRPGDKTPEIPIYAQSWLPATAYGWSPLEALTLGRHRLVVAPRPELYDWRADPGEMENLVDRDRAMARSLKAAYESYTEGLDKRQAPAVSDPELRAELSSLGYLSGASGERKGTLDPKDGIRLLAEFELAKLELASGREASAVARLRELVKKSPDNVPFLSNLGSALLTTGGGKEAVEVLRRAVGLNPGLEFLHLRLAEAYRTLGRYDEAEAEYRLTVELDPRQAGAWLGLAEIALRRGDGPGELDVLRRAVGAGTESAPLYLRLGQIEASKDPAGAAGHLRRATELAPDWPLAWLLRGEAQSAAGDGAAARTSLERVLTLAPGTPLARRAAQILREGA